MVSLEIAIAGLELRNPVMSASGTFGHGLEMKHFTAPSAVGALVSKTVTLAPRPGNPSPRISETEAGFLNSIGLENRGLEAYLADVLPVMAAADTVVVTNIGGESPGEFAELAARLDERPEVDALEINLSCPNVQGGRLPFATSAAAAEEVVAGVRAATRKPVFAKVSPNCSDVGAIARGAEAAGADGITAINTLLGMAVDWRSGEPALATIQGGYSGPAIKPVALRCVWACAQAVSIPILGCGGVASAEDVLAFLAAGASAVQVGTASFADPGLPARIAAELGPLLEGAGHASAAELIGTVRDGRGRAPLAAAGEYT